MDKDTVVAMLTILSITMFVLGITLKLVAAGLKFWWFGGLGYGGWRKRR